MTEAPDTVVALVDKYLAHRKDYESDPYKEAQARQEFINPLFEQLGWDMDNKAGWAEAYKDVVHEDSVKVQGKAKAPDYGFRIGGVRKFFVEAKAPHVKLSKEKTGAYQVRRYAWSARLPISVLTNFREFVIYDCTARPKPTDGPAVGRLLSIKVEDFREHWDKIAGVFSREAILRGDFDKYATIPNRRGTAAVDNAFLRQIEDWRAVLAEDLVEHNSHISERQLNGAVQSLIDRIIFLRICEDRGLEDYGRLQGTLKGKGNVYGKLRKLFDQADAKYNSGLFHFKKEPNRPDPDTLTPKLDVSDNTLHTIVEQLYYPESPFEFSVISADILGQVYERFLGKVIEIGETSTKIEDKPEVRRAGGVYYTPVWVVSFLVARTVGAALEDIAVEDLALGGKRRRRFRVLDPACGSGSFLIVAYQHLLDWYLARYTQDSERWAGPKQRRIYKIKGEWRLSLDERKRILVEHIFGVDIDSQAVEVTKLSLLLKVLEGETSQTLAPALWDERALPDLDRNVRCGNSLVGPEIDARFDIDLTIDERIRTNAFDWHENFTFLHQNAPGAGFDVVIGNPPYVYRNALQERLRAYYQERYESAQGNYELYKFFVERGLELTKRGGKLGFITSASFLVQSSFSLLRKKILDTGCLVTLAPLGPGVFIKATVDSAIIVVGRGPQDDNQVEVRAPRTPTELPDTEPYYIPQSRFKNNAGYTFDYRVTPAGKELLDRLDISFPKIDVRFDFGVGINTGYIRDELTSRKKHGGAWHRMVPGKGISRYGSIRTDGYILYDPDFVKSKGSRGRSLPQERFLHDSKILVVRTRNLSLNRRVVATLDESRSYNLNRLSNIISRNGQGELLGLLGFLNSDLFNWMFSTRYYDYEIKPIYLRDCPLADDHDTKLVLAVQKVLELHGSLESETDQQAKYHLRKAVEATEAAINERVFELYGVTQSERSMIGEQLDHFSSGAQPGASSDADEDVEEDELEQS